MTSKPVQQSRWFRHHKKILAVVIVMSILSVFFSPLGELKQKLISKSPLILVLLVITEAAFIIGVGIMAYSVEAKLSKNPLQWRKQLKTVLCKASQSRIFWAGFVINSLGALGTGIVIGVGVITILPRTSWGLLWVSVADIALTISVRAIIIEIRNEYKMPSRESSKS